MIAPPKYLAALLFLASVAPVLANIRMPAIYSDNMVLQARAKMTVRGMADPGESVTVRLGNRRTHADADAQGRWLVTLPRVKGSGPYDLTISGKNEVTIHNVVVGDVWLCAGASNMALPLNAVDNAQQEITGAKFPMIRMFKVQQKVADKPVEACEGTWVVCDPRSARDFSALGYFFGRELNGRLKVPIGLINVSVSATPIQSWLPAGSDPGLKGMEEAWKAEMAAYPAANQEYEQSYAGWQQAALQAKTAGERPPPPPRRPKGPEDPSAPGGIYNGMIAPLLSFPPRGIAWYQGEADTSEPERYRSLFSSLIRSWRKNFATSDLPFVFVQLANFLPRSSEPEDSLWAELREAQAAALKLPGTGMAVTIDIGDEHSMLPKNKKEAGHRLAQAALASAYGEEAGLSPIFASMKVGGRETAAGIPECCRRTIWQGWRAHYGVRYRWRG